MATPDQNAHITMANASRLANNIKAKVIAGLAKKVDKVDGSRLMLDTEGTKLGGIAEGAQVNVIESIVLDNSASQNSIAEKVATLGMAAYALKTDITAAVHYKGTVATYSALPTEGMATGDMYNVTAADAEHGINAGDNVVYNGTGWDNMSGIVDLSGKVDKETGKGLSTNDFTNNLKNKLDAISEQANKTTISVESFTNAVKVAALGIDGTETEVKVPAVTISAEYIEGLKIGSVQFGDNAAINLYVPVSSADDIDSITADWDL